MIQLRHFIKTDKHSKSYKHARCKKCGKIMKNVQEGHADLCYDCEEE